jgi:hypothetical protein
MSFKDKPLKKIVSDNRKTIDVIHHEMIDSFKDEKKEINDQKDKLLRGGISNENDIIEKEKELKSKEIGYYMKSGLLLHKYYSNKINENTSKSKVNILDLMNKKSIETNEKTDLISDYMSIIDDTVISNKHIKNNKSCPVCSERLLIQERESILFCETCGHIESIVMNTEKTSYKDPPRESSYFAYKRINHFNEWLAQFQAKETTEIPSEIYNGIMEEIKKDPFMELSNIDYKQVRTILKKLKYNKYYEHIPHIINVLTGKDAPILSREYEEQLRMMFKDIQNPFIKHCPHDRKNFLSYSYVLHKFCQLLELDHLLDFFPLLKSREKLQQQDAIWKKICETLQWQYIPSI